MTSTDLEPRGPATELVAWMRADDRRNQIAAALPEGVSLERFERATATALMEKPELVDADRRSLYLAVMRAAQAGLVPDGKQGAIVVYGKKATFLPMIGGVRDTLAEYGWSLITSVIYQADEFSIDVANGRVTHIQPRPGVARGAAEGAYAQAIHRDGRRMAEMMTVDEINHVRDTAARSKNVWNEWWTRMAEKTVGHRLAKKLPLAPQDRRRLDIILQDLEPGEAATVMYGARELDPASPERSGQAESVGVSHGPLTGGADTDAAAAPPSSPASSSRAGEGDSGAEPGPAAPDGEPDPAISAAEEAGRFDPKSTKWPGMTIREIFESGDEGRAWVAWCVVNAKRAALVDAVTAFAAVYMPEALR